jgi:tetratricopeptide (TPR) repeat protein
MIAVLDKMEEVMPEDVIPQRMYQLSLNLGMMYAQGGRPEEFGRRIDRVLRMVELPPMDKLSLATIYSQQVNDPAKAESLANSVMQDYPERPEPYSWLVSFYVGSKNYERSIELLEQMQSRFPDNAAATQQLEMIKRLAAEDTVSNGTGP